MKTRDTADVDTRGEHADLTADDLAQLHAINGATDPRAFLALAAAYYADVDRAARVPAPWLMFHLGALTAILRRELAGRASDQ